MSMRTLYSQRDPHVKISLSKMYLKIKILTGMAIHIFKGPDPPVTYAYANFMHVSSSSDFNSTYTHVKLST